MTNPSELRRCVNQVERRLLVRRCLAAWPGCAAAAFGAAACLVVVDHFQPLGIVASSVVMIALAASMIASLAWAWLRRDDASAAAVELDRRCELAERASSALALGATVADEPPAAQAVRADAERALARVDVAASFPLAPSRRAAWPLVPAAVCAALALLIAPRSPVVDPAAAAVDRAQVQESTEALAKKLAQKRRTAESLKLAEAQRLLEKLQEETKRLQADGQLDRKEALVKLNDLAEQLEGRRREVGGAEELKKQLSRLRSKHSGPADKLAQSLGKGDYRGASDQLQQLRKQLEAKGLDDKQKEQLAKQLDDLQRQLDDLAKKQEERRREAEQQSAQGLKSKKSGGDAGASAEKLAELSQMAAGAAAEDKQLQQLQRALENAVDNLNLARGDQAGQALNDLQQQLDALAAQSDELQLLDGGLQDLAECKAGCCRGDGQGTGQAASNGGAPGNRQGQGGQGQQALVGQGGTKPGVGTSRNENPTDVDDKNAFNSRVRTEVGTSPLEVVGPMDGPNAKGRALQAIREQAAAVVDGGESQPVANQPLDRSRRDQKRQYFDALRQAD